MILVIGSKGNMGQRYGAILNHLGHKPLGFDSSVHSPKDLEAMASKASKVIIATPTHTHLSVISDLADYQIPILCEKPLVKNVFDMMHVMNLVEKKNLNLRMVNQYEYIPTDQVNPVGDTFYNFFKHGGDGLVWDCINIIGLAREKIVLKESSPVWRCAINGNHLCLKDVDLGYIDMIASWSEKPTDNLDYIEKTYTKIFEHFQGGNQIECHTSPNWYTG